MLTSTAIVLFASVTLGQTDGEKVFKSYVDHAVGGVWTTTANGQRVESVYRRLPDNPFVQLTCKGGPIPYVGIIGVDPATKKCVWWFFNNDGSIGKDTLTQEADRVFLLEGTGSGPKGNIRYKGRITQVDENTVTEEVIEFVVYGQKHPAQKFTWTRQP